MKRGTLNAEETLMLLFDFSLRALDDLETQDREGRLTDYQRGLKSIHVEYLEQIQKNWEKAIDVGLDFDIEDTFPV